MRGEADETRNVSMQDLTLGLPDPKLAKSDLEFLLNVDKTRLANGY